MTTNQVASRPLGFIESMFQVNHELGAAIVVQVARIQGSLSSELVTEVFKALQQRHPLLQARVGESENGSYEFCIDNPSPALPLQIVEPSTEDWQALAEAQMHAPFDFSTGPLWRVVFVPPQREDDLNTLVMAFHHSICDGLSITNLVHEFLIQSQQKLTNLKTEVLEPLPLLPAMETLCQNSPKADPSPSASPPPEPIKLTPFHFDGTANPGDRRSRSLYGVLGSDTLTQLKQASKEHKTTIHGALCAAVLRALDKTVFEEKPITLTCLTGMNVRSKCDPAVSPAQFGCFVSGVSTLSSLDGNTPFWELARQCKQDIEQAAIAQFPPSEQPFNKAEILPGMNHIIHGENMGRFAMVNFSNLGRLNFLPTYDPLTLQELFFTGCQHSLGFYLSLHAQTLYGQLYYSFAYVVPLMSDDTAASFESCFIKELQDGCSHL